MTYLSVSNVGSVQIKLNKIDSEYRSELWSGSERINKSNWVWSYGEAMMNFWIFEELARGGHYSNMSKPLS